MVLPKHTDVIKRDIVLGLLGSINSAAAVNLADIIVLIVLSSGTSEEEILPGNATATIVCMDEVLLIFGHFRIVVVTDSIINLMGKKRSH